MDKDVKRYQRALEQLKADRATFNSQWDEVSKVVVPYAASFTSEHDNPGEKKGQDLYDATGVHCNELLSAGFYSLLTNPAQKWFNLATTNPDVNMDRDVDLWLAEVSRIMYFEMHKPTSGFTTSLHEAYLSLCAYGNAIMFVTESPDLKTLQFSALPLQECYYTEAANGSVRSLFRSYKRTVLQLYDMFPYDSLSKPVRHFIDKEQWDEKVEVLHVIEPDQERAGAYRSLYIDASYAHIMSEGRFNDRPFMVARFYKTSYEVYGRGPGSSALPDLKMLQQVVKTTIRGAQKMVDPPIMVPDKGFIGTIRTVPGGVSYFRQGLSNDDKIMPLVTGGKPDLGEELANSIRGRIREIFYVDQLQLSTGPQMTATEVLQRSEEKMRLLGPVTGRAQAELLGPCIERVFSLLMHAGRLPAPPDILLDPRVKLKVTYQSTLFKSQEQTEANSVLRITQLMAPFMSLDPSVMDVFDPETIARALGNMYALNPNFYRSEEEVRAIRQQRAQAQQQAQMTEALKSGGSGLKDMAQGMAALGGLQ